MPYQNSKYNRPFTPRKPVRTFRDLDVYQKTLECSVLIVRNLIPVLEKFGEEKGKKKQEVKYAFTENMTNCSMTVPLLVGEAHSIRFASLESGVAFLEKAMAGCNKMVIYLEQIKGIYGAKVDASLIDDLINRYMDSRVKMFHLEKSWKRFSYPVTEVKKY